MTYVIDWTLKMSQQPQTTYSQPSETLELLQGSALDPYTLRRIFLLLCRNHYADPSFFGNVPDSFRDFEYSDEQRKSRVRIELDFLFDPERAERDTAIFVGVSDIKTNNSKVVDAFAQLNNDSSGREYTNTDTCQAVLTHVAPTADEALIMGIISKGFFQGMRTLLQQRLCLRGYSVDTLSRPKPVTPDAANPNYRVDLTINLAFSSDWVTSIESHRIKRVNFELG